MNQINRHIERTIGPSPMVFHEIIAPDIHLDLHIVPPHRKHNFYTIITSGMSTRAMNPPPDADPDAARFAELMAVLPADWPGLRPDGTFVQEGLEDEANWWPIRWLKMIARMPYEYDSYIGAGQMIPNGQRAERYAANTEFGGMLLMPSALHPRSQRLVVHDDRSIEFLALWPLYPEEMELQRTWGTEALRTALAQAGVTELVDIRRRNVGREGRQ